MTAALHDAIWRRDAAAAMELVESAGRRTPRVAFKYHAWDVLDYLVQVHPELCHRGLRDPVEVSKARIDQLRNEDGSQVVLAAYEAFHTEAKQRWAYTAAITLKFLFIMDGMPILRYTE
jgi:hypothetical protein